MDSKFSITHETEHPWLLSSDEVEHGKNEQEYHPTSGIEKIYEMTTPIVELRRQRLQPASKRFLWSIVLHIALLTANLIIAFGFYDHGRQNIPRPLSGRTYSPADTAVTYSGRMSSTLYNDTVNPFLQSLDQSEDLWRTYSQNDFIRISGEEMRLLNRTGGVMLTDGSGDYMASLDVYHQLHCLHYLREFIERGPPRTVGITPIGHAYHCIEHLRQVIECHGDIAVITYDWRPNDPMPWTRWEMEHTCVNWQALDDWATKRRLPHDFRTTLVKNPLLDNSLRASR